MPNRLPIVDNLCTHPENHGSHLCELLQAGEEERAQNLSEPALFVCGNCARKANSKGALCAPGPIE